MPLNSYEQYLLELTNRARLDPLGEAARYGIDLNDGLSPNAISGESKQVLSSNNFLQDSASNHSQWMLDEDVFSHTGEGGTDAGDRMEYAGYSFLGNWTWGENLAWTGTRSGYLNLEASIDAHHEGLFLSADHRVNTLNDNFREVGIAQELGAFTDNGLEYDSSMTTLNFASSGNDVFVTGVSYIDVNDNLFYDVGEGSGSINFSMAGGDSIINTAAGGWSLAATNTNGYNTVTISYGQKASEISINVRGQNQKLDFVNDDTIVTDTDVALLQGDVTQIQLLGDHNATATGNSRDNVFQGNRGNNVLNGEGGHDALAGGAGDDILNGSTGDDILHGETGVDKLYGGSNNDDLYGGEQNDILSGGFGDDRLWGDEGNDTVNGDAGDDLIHGNDGDDLLNGSTGNDRIFGGDGNDNQNGHSGDDLIRSHAGDDEGRGGSGNDTLEGQSGDDLLYGGNDDDIVYGHVGQDLLYGGSGNDRVYGGLWSDQLYGGDGMDDLYGGQSNDYMWGNSGNDLLLGDDGRDRLHGDAGNDILDGGTGNDALFGGSGSDDLYGGNGDDRLDGSQGADELTGGAGADQFVFKAGQAYDTVTDFDAREGDMIGIDSDFFAPGTTLEDFYQNSVNVGSQHTYIDLGDGENILLQNTTDVLVDDFYWV